MSDVRHFNLVIALAPAVTSPPFASASWPQDRGVEARAGRHVPQLGLHPHQVVDRDGPPVPDPLGEEHEQVVASA
jgi:hypothetical protein